MNRSRVLTFVDWLLRIIASMIMLQTLFFKFTGAAESIYIFSKLGMEPWGRLAIGSMELIASCLLLIPSTVLCGAVLGACLMAGALYFHATTLGLVVLDDHGQLFTYACLTLTICIVLSISHRFKWPISLITKRNLNEK